MTAYFLWHFFFLRKYLNLVHLRTCGKKGHTLKKNPTWNSSKKLQMQIIQESGAHAEYWIVSIVKVILNLRISLGGNNNFGYLRWSNWIFWFPLSPNWMCKWSVCTMNLCPWLFSPASAWEMCACAWICTKPHGVSFPAVSSQEPPEHTHNTNGLLIGLVLATFSCPFLVLLFDPR